MEEKQRITYKGSGVNYEDIDPFKMLCQIAARTTDGNADRFGVTVEKWSRGESAFVLKISNDACSVFISHVEEGLGTKNLVADAMFELTEKSYYDQVPKDTIAMIVNDMITIKTFPICLAMHVASGDSEWFKNQQRCEDLINGWRDGCNEARCIWGPGETPVLKGIVDSETVLLSGSAMGINLLHDDLKKPSVECGDAIIILQSSGIHANGLTSCRVIARSLDNGYLTRLSDNRTYGETLLDPTHIYVGVIEDLLIGNFNINYMVNITGHGWRKLMRLEDPFTYRIHTLPPALPIFDFIQKHGMMDDKEAYGNFNMGAGFALFVKQRDAEGIVNFINEGGYGFKALVAGIVEKGNKQVIIEPKDLTFKADTLAVR
jgi:phosphoribosylformylglycinamidine cyclo-ligase